MNFDSAFDRLLGHEGEYSNNPQDPGGETMWGITIAVARANGYTGAMRNLPKDTAKSIYRKLYWDAVKADQLADSVNFDVFDGAVNSGVSRSIRWLQAASGVDQDGIIGPKTIDASKASGVAARYNGERLQFMTDSKNWSVFSKGWARRIAKNLKEIK